MAAVEEPTAVGADAHSRAALLEQLRPGLIIADKYRIEETLGRGAMGVVVAARHLALDERVALKFLLLDDDAQQFRSRFAREARVCAKLRNEHVVRVTDFGVYRDVLAYMVMDCLAGKDLRATLAERGGPLEVNVAIDYAVQVCEGLAEVHGKGIVHRDLKPSNLFLTARSDGSTLLKILDFGISKWTDPRNVEGGNVEADAELTETGMLLGTPKFMAPEQLFGSSSIDARADVWSVGAIAYVMLTGRAPFEAPTFAVLCARLSTGESPEPPSKLRPELPAALDAAVLGALKHRVDERTASVAELAGDLLAAIGAARADEVRARLRAVLPPPVRSASASSSLTAAVAVSAPRREKKRAHLWAVAASVLVAAVVLSLLVRRSEPRAPELAAAPSALPRPSVEPSPPSAPEAVHSSVPAPSSSVGPAIASAPKKHPTAKPPPAASGSASLKTLLGDRQ